MDKLLELPQRTRSVFRWTGVPILGHRNNISEHSFEVALFSLLIYNECCCDSYGVDKGDLLQYSLIHDIPEVYTGDLPASLKQLSPEIKALLDSVEETLFNKELNAINITPDINIKYICKVADYLSVKIEHVLELSLGNNSDPINKATTVIEKIYNKLDSDKWKSVDPDMKERIDIFIINNNLMS